MVSLNDVLYVVETILLWSSVLGATCVVVTYTYFDELLTVSAKLIVYLCLCVVFGYISLWLGLHITLGWLCQMLALITHYLLLANLAWCCCLAINFYQTIVRQYRDIVYLLNWYHPLCWGLPLIPCIINTIFHAYGSADGICFIQGEILRSATFILPGLVILCTNALLFFFIGREIHIMLQGASNTEKRKYRQELRIYFSVFISIGLTWTVIFILYMVYSVPILGLAVKIIASVIAPTQGILLFITYCCTVQVRIKWSSVLVKIGLTWFQRYVETDSTTISAT